MCALFLICSLIYYSNKKIPSEAPATACVMMTSDVYLVVSVRLFVVDLILINPLRIIIIVTIIIIIYISSYSTLIALWPFSSKTQLKNILRSYSSNTLHA